MRALLASMWGFLRALTGDDAYERYLRHFRTSHAGETPLDARSFYHQEQERRFGGGPNRCC